MNRLPELTVVVVGSRPQGPPAELRERLEPAGRAGRVEVVVATARADAAEPDRPDWLRVLPCPAGTTVPELRLSGVRAARGGLIAITEDFCAPCSGWAEALLQHHREAPSAVLGGPIARQGGERADWALTLIEYGRYFDPHRRGIVDDLPSINVAYPREVLMAALPADARGILEVELHARLRTTGAVFCRVPTAVMFDTNSAELSAAARAQYHHGRLFGGGRVERTGWSSRLKFAALSPAVPVILFSRIAREVAAAGHSAELCRALPSLSVLLGAWAVGEGLGSLLGPGDSASHWA